MKKPTQKECRYVVNLLVEIIMRRLCTDDMKEFFDDVYKQYNLYDNPFTRFPCTAEEYAENSVKYERQTLQNKYGYWE